MNQIDVLHEGEFGFFFYYSDVVGSAKRSSKSKKAEGPGATPVLVNRFGVAQDQSKGWGKPGLPDSSSPKVRYIHQSY